MFDRIAKMAQAHLEYGATALLERRVVLTTNNATARAILDKWAG